MSFWCKVVRRGKNEVIKRKIMTYEKKKIFFVIMGV